MAQLAVYVDARLRDDWTEWPGGWPDQIEIALVDAVMSIRARYGRPAAVSTAATGVHRAVAGYRQLRAPTLQLDDLAVLASLDWRTVERAVGRQVTGGVPKARAIVEAAGRLTDVGVTSAAHLDLSDMKQVRAYTGVRGLGKITWEYFGMLLGRPGVKADRWVIAAVDDAVKRRTSPAEAREIVLATAEAIGKGPTELEHALWAHRRRSARGAAAGVGTR
ncbi:hypothetical protein GCU67_00745 [Modestobacter muralis]|uniref:HhH-GPD domain-containing protein n=1 Tax=Modestobacter muralis TaxID=1608614 RepID=A0A6P0ERY2_9ACTN|nr:hypothetical protein [Modestobacter muralis]NEK92704.1 hypothetical protein [Modestobacter muralis]NEN49471.1 hypothetical protein [Modestobacter muralis]